MKCQKRRRTKMKSKNKRARKYQFAVASRCTSCGQHMVRIGPFKKRPFELFEAAAVGNEREREREKRLSYWRCYRLSKKTKEGR